MVLFIFRKHLQDIMMTIRRFVPLGRMQDVRRIVCKPRNATKTDGINSRGSKWFNGLVY